MEHLQDIVLQAQHALKENPTLVGGGLIIAVLALKRLLQPTVNNGPGPKGLPVLGSALDMPKEDDFLVYSRWSDKWGDLFRLTVLGQPIYIIGSLKVATELLEKKSLIYSDRPVMPMAQDLVGWGRTLVLTSSNDPRFRHYRKMFHTALNKEAVKQYEKIQETSIHHTLGLFLRDPDDFVHHIRFCIGATIMKITYDYDMKRDHDPFLKLAEDSADNFSKSAAPGQWMVDVLPILKYVPSWFPGAGFKKTAAEWKETNETLHRVPYEEVVRQIDAGTANPSALKNLLCPDDGPRITDPEQEDMIKWVVGAFYSGGADTAASALHTFVLAMVRNPDVQKKAQAELDSVIGTSRLPTIADRPNLPYIEAVYKETLRWHPVAPLAVPHRLSKDDEYNGIKLPKGSLIIPNIWRMAKEGLTDGDDYKPERHLGNNAIADPRQFVFGFGRRVCPGIHLADSEVWLTIANVLACFDILKKPDGKGGFITPKDEYIQGIICHPKPFPCDIRPRSDRSRALIEEILAKEGHTY